MAQAHARVKVTSTRVGAGPIPVADGRIRPAGAVEGLVRPERTMPEASICLYGIRPADLADASGLDVAIDPLLAALAASVRRRLAAIRSYPGPVRPLGRR
jgi:hypothetical protein